MAEILKINQIDNQKISSSKPTTQGPSGPIPVNPLILALLMIIDSMSVQQTSAQIQCKQLQSNASAQDSLNNQEANINFKIWTKSMAYTLKKELVTTFIHGTWEFFTGTKRKKVEKWVKTAKPGDPMESVDTFNLGIQGARDRINNEILVLRQNAQVGQAQLNSSIDQTEQTVQEGSGIMQLISSTTNLITR